MAPPDDTRLRRLHALASLCLLAGCVGPHAGRGSLASRLGGSAFVSSAPVSLAPGLVYREVACRVGDDVVHLRQLSLRAGSAVSLRAVPNSSARTDDHCPQRYGGRDLREVLPAVAGFRVLGATNGNFFHRLGAGFRANGMIWSLGAGGGSWLAPLQSTADPDFRGDRLALVDADGLHELRIDTGACEPGRCAATVTPATPAATLARLGGRLGPMSQDELLAALRAAFPTLTLAMQINHAYEGGPGDALAASFRCTAARRWTCDPHPVTLLCGSREGVSLLAAERVAYPSLPAGLRPGGPCDTRCEALYILDGGGSTQVARVDPSNGSLVIEYAGKVYPNAPDGCSLYRPVDHYLAFGLGTDAPAVAPPVAPPVLE